jgi:hypothetical protein
MPLKYFYHDCGKALEAVVHVIKLFGAEFTFLQNKLECLALTGLFTRLQSTYHLPQCLSENTSYETLFWLSGKVVENK